MEEKSSEEEAKCQIYSEARGQYTIILGNKAWNITFPIDAKIEDNIKPLEEMVKALYMALENQKKTEKEKVEEKAKDQE